MIKKIHDLVCPNKKIYKDRNNYQVVWKNKNDIDYLSKLDICEKKTKNIGLPIVPNMWHLIRGIFDGDGSIHIDKTIDKKYGKTYFYKNISIVSGSAKFVNELSTFFNNEYIKFTLTQDHRHDNVFCFNIRTRDAVKKMYDKMYKNSYDWKLYRKYKMFQE